jgi:putative transposase
MCSGMSTQEVKQIIESAIEFSGIDDPHILYLPRLLSNNGPCYASKALGQYLETKGIIHTRGKPYHSMTRGKIERYHRLMNSILQLENYCRHCELEDQIGLFVDYYNNLTLADVYHGKSREILLRRERIKKIQ